VNRNFAGKVVALTVSFALLSPTSSFADQKSGPQPPAPASEAGSSYKAAMDKFREDQKTYLEAIKTYEEKRRAINKVFKDSVEKALSDAKALSAPGQTQLQKRQAVSNKQVAIITATSIRDAAIEALGLPPVQPTPPAKPIKEEKANKPRPQNSSTPSAN